MNTTLVSSPLSGEFWDYTDEQLISIAEIQTRHMEHEELRQLVLELATRLADGLDECE